MDRFSGEELDAHLRAFLSEDIGETDITTDAAVPEGSRARGELVAKSSCVVSGLSVARRTFELLDPDVTWESAVSPGTQVEAGTVLARLVGRARAILTAERVALNLLQRMCGIATATRRFVEAVAGTGCQILDTRKTAPGLRPFDRMAVADGGGKNHRYDLSEMVLIKDNHRRLAGSLARAVRSARQGAPPGIRIEVEVETEEELREALAGGADALLVDNQSAETVSRFVRLARQANPAPSLEASGNVGLHNVREYALAGVDFVSVGSLTHSVMAADISLELEPE